MIILGVQILGTLEDPLMTSSSNLITDLNLVNKMMPMIFGLIYGDPPFPVHKYYKAMKGHHHEIHAYKWL